MSDKYESRIKLVEYYNKILERQIECRENLNQIQLMEHTDISYGDLEAESIQKDGAETLFKSNLNYYYDSVRDKFDKTDIDKPKRVRELEDEEKIFSVYQLNLDEAVQLYRQCNALMEELGITSAEKIKRMERGIGGKQLVQENRG